MGCQEQCVWMVSCQYCPLKATETVLLLPGLLMMQTFLRGAKKLVRESFILLGSQQRVNHSCWYISTHFCCMRCTILSYHTTIAMVPHSFSKEAATCQTLLSLGFHEPNYQALFTLQISLISLKVYLLLSAEKTIGPEL